MPAEHGLSARQALVKRGFDVAVAGAALVVAFPVILVARAIAAADTRDTGMFRQLRVGRHGEPFELLKIRTMRAVPGVTTTVTAAADVRITRSGVWFRRLKIDELPQLYNVLRGEMSLVGPRPDVPGFADMLQEADRVVLSVRPGITGPAAVAYRHEEALLAAAVDPEAHNRNVIWPDKVRINREYVENYSLMTDIRCLVDTVSTVLSPTESESEHHG